MSHWCKIMNSRSQSKYMVKILSCCLINGQTRQMPWLIKKNRHTDRPEILKWMGKEGETTPGQKGIFKSINRDYLRFRHYLQSIEVWTESVDRGCEPGSAMVSLPYSSMCFQEWCVMPSTHWKTQVWLLFQLKIKKADKYWWSSPLDREKLGNSGGPLVAGVFECHTWYANVWEEKVSILFCFYKRFF